MSPGSADPHGPLSPGPRSVKDSPAVSSPSDDLAEEARASHSPGALIDVDFTATPPARFIAWWVGGYCALGAVSLAIGYMAVGSRLTTLSVIGVLSADLAVFAIVTLGVTLGWPETRVRWLVQLGKGRPIDTVVRAVVEKTAWVGGTAFVRPMVALLAKQGRFGVTVRVAPPHARTPIEPLGVPFEPCPLDDTTAAFHALEGAPPAAEARAGDTTQGHQRRDLATDGPRAASPWWIRAAGDAWVAITIILFLALVLVKHRAITPSLLFGVGVAIVWATTRILYSVTARHRSRCQWLIVPGGLVLRRATLLGPGWRVRLFDRRRSVLFVHLLEAQGRAPWRLTVADAGGLERTTATKAEIDLVLRGWLSPLHPPSQDRLTDLT